MSIRNDYDTLGYAHSIPILSDDEVLHYRVQVEHTRSLLADRVARLDAPHRFFRWAWTLSTHPLLLRTLQQLLGSRVVLKSTRLFYKEPHSASYVGWHQDGITEQQGDARVPAVWIGLTDATIENGCLRVVPRSHNLGLVRHRELPDGVNLTTSGITAHGEFEPAQDIVMRAGQMSLHHPLLLHASNPNRSAEPRIGFSATYCAEELADDACVWLEDQNAPHWTTVDAACAAYRDSGEQVLCASR